MKSVIKDIRTDAWCETHLTLADCIEMNVNQLVFSNIRYPIEYEEMKDFLDFVFFDMLERVLDDEKCYMITLSMKL